MMNALPLYFFGRHVVTGSSAQVGASWSVAASEASAAAGYGRPLLPPCAFTAICECAAAPRRLRIQHRVASLDGRMTTMRARHYGRRRRRLCRRRRWRLVLLRALCVCACARSSLWRFRRASVTALSLCSAALIAQRALLIKERVALWHSNRLLPLMSFLPCALTASREFGSACRRRAVLAN